MDYKEANELLNNPRREEFMYSEEEIQKLIYGKSLYDLYEKRIDKELSDKNKAIDAISKKVFKIN